MTDRYELINREEGHYPVSSMCRWSGVSKSGYYSWRDRPQSQTAVWMEELAIIIKDVFEDSDGTYGYRRIQVVLERRGVRVGWATIRSIMRDLGLQAAGPRAKVRTTVPAQDLDERPDLLRRDFTADEPGRKWCGDIPLPCWWSWVVRGRVSCCGHDVLPLSADDPGAKVTRSSRALVTADKGNGPQCVRSNAYMGAGPAVHRLAPYQLDREAAGEMNIEDIEVLRRHRASARSEHWATALSRDGACSMVCVSPCGRTDTDDCY